jgi:AmmeMemoRadiSam system protein A
MEKSDTLTEAQGQTLIALARRALEDRIRPDETSGPSPAIDPALHRLGASFVTLTIHGALRGCIGTPQARVPLAEDVQENAIRAALMDPRFPPVTADELDELEIEVSVLTPPRPLDCPPEERAERVQPGVDGLLLASGFHRGLLLPQVWDKIPDPKDFMAILCQKAGLSPSAWRRSDTELRVFQVQAFVEKPELSSAGGEHG